MVHESRAQSSRSPHATLLITASLFSLPAVIEVAGRLRRPQSGERLMHALTASLSFSPQLEHRDVAASQTLRAALSKVRIIHVALN